MNLPKTGVKNYSAINRNRSRVSKKKYFKRPLVCYGWFGFNNNSMYSSENSLVKELKK